MTAVLLIATMLDSKISSLVWSYHFELLPSHRTNTVRNVLSAICDQLHVLYRSCISNVTPTFVRRRADVHVQFPDSRYVFRRWVYGFSWAAFRTSVAAFMHTRAAFATQSRRSSGNGLRSTASFLKTWTVVHIYHSNSQLTGWAGGNGTVHEGKEDKQVKQHYYTLTSQNFYW